MQSDPNYNRRILIVDDNAAIHEDFRKILGLPDAPTSTLDAHESALFGAEIKTPPRAAFQLDSALQGEEGIQFVEHSLRTRDRYALAFVDARMPPGIDGIETIARIWGLDPEIQIVLCTAHSDYTWHEISRRLGRLDQLLILKKPFDSIEVLQLAESLVRKWSMNREEQLRIASLESRILERGRELHAVEIRNAQLDEAHKQLVAATRLTSDIKGTSARWQMLERELRDAVELRQITVHYQPVVAVKSRRIVSVEALVRWQHPQLGAISPAEFIPIAEQTGLILPLGQFVLRCACEQVMQWEREGVPTVPVAVNVSPVQLELQDFGEQVMRILRETSMPAHKLSVELTESTFVASSSRNSQALQELRSSGVRVQIDDFGTGYSCLGYLRHLPIDAIKLDRSFVQRLGVDPTDEAIVAAILAMARSLRLSVIAEGVETALQLDVLARQDCEAAQGFYFSKPLVPDQCRQLLLDLRERPSFTETLRIQLSALTGSRPSPVSEPSG